MSHNMTAEQLDLVTLDFETYYDSDYTLKKMSTSQYVYDPRFETIGVAITRGNMRVWLEDYQFRLLCKQLPWHNIALLAHHAHFDGLILSHHYGVKPGFWYDTLSMARAIHGEAVAADLDSLMRRYGIGQKGHEVIEARGKRRVDFTPAEWQQYGVYSINDCDGTTGLFNRMASGFPQSELELIDITVRMFTEPVMVLDEPKTQEYLEWEIARKEALLSKIGADKKALGSNDKFAGLLRDMGIDPPMKDSPTAKDAEGNPKRIFAFAKSDPAFQELLMGGDEDTRLLCEARVGVKSAGNETRTARLLDIGRDQRALPVYLKYAGAGTFRWSGGDKMNWQNFERMNKKDKRKGTIRQSVRAPKGMLLFGGDASQIEARFNAWYSGQQDIVDAFARGEDVYSLFASDIYGRPINRKTNPDDEIPGHVGKTCLAAGTLLITSRGILPIQDVARSDKVWDGNQWVEHQGVICLGEKEVVLGYGLAATADHEILTAHGWREWSEVRTNHSLFLSALSQASLPSSGGRGSTNLMGNRAGGGLLSGALADAKAQLIGATLPGGRLPAVTRARRRRRLVNATGNMKPRSQTLHTVSVCLTGWLRRLLAATPRLLSTISTTAAGASRCVTSGVLTEPHFYGTPRLCPGGTTPRWTSIGSIMMPGMARGIFALFRAHKTQQTSGRSETCNLVSPSSRRRSLVYDLVNAGPLNRYTILAAGAPIIVHNCILGLGYNMGYLKFGGEMLRGANGGAPVQFVEEDLHKLHIDPTAFLANPKNVERILEVPGRLPPAAKLIHYTVANYIVDVYRTKNDKIKANWGAMKEVIDLMHQGYRGPVGKNGIIELVEDGILLPSGLVMHYRELKWETDENGRNGSYSYLAKRGQRSRLYGGMLTENLTQALCRIIVSDAMVQLRKEGLRGDLKRITTMEHDAIIGVAPAAEAPYWSARLLELIATAPSWAAGLPLAAEGGFGETLGDTK